MGITEKYISKQKDFSELGVKPSFPKIIKIDICNTCNYSCIFCPQSKQTGKVGSIDDDLCVSVIRDAYCAGAREICLSSTGEPLLNKNLPRYIIEAKKVGYTYVFFNTNGYLMDERWSRDVICGGVDSVKFSINADKESYNLIHGVDAYDKVISNLKIFDRIRKETGSDCRLYVSYVATKYTQSGVKQVSDDVSSYADEIMVMNANNRGGIADEVDDDLYAGDDMYSYSFPCSQIFNNLYVTAEGYVVACCQDFENNLVIADLHDMSVKDAWNCESFVSFRRRFLNQDYAGLLCDNCLNNTHNTISPLNNKVSGYEHSDKRIADIRRRIRLLKELSKKQ